MESIKPVGSDAAALELQDTYEVSFDIIGIVRLLTGPMAALVFWNLPLGLEPNIQKTFAIVVFMIVYWIVEALPHAVTALVGCYLFWALDVVKISVAFSGFASSTPWFVFACLLMGEAASKTNLVQRLGYWVMLRVGTSYSRLLLGIITISFLLNFLIPNAVARVSMLAPIAIGILTVYGLGKHSNAGKGLFLILTYSCPLFAKMMMSGPAAISPVVWWKNRLACKFFGVSGSLHSCPWLSSRSSLRGSWFAGSTQRRYMSSRAERNI